MVVWLLLLAAIVIVLAMVLWLRWHPFLALLIAGWVVAVGTPAADLQRHVEGLVLKGKLNSQQSTQMLTQSGTQRLTKAFGETAGQIGVLIALASVLGACLAESGAAYRIVASSLTIVGVNRAPLALACSSFLLGIPIYFDTVFYLMVPLAKSLCARIGKDYVYYILAIMAGGSIAHSLIPPTPGPLQVATILGVDVLTLLGFGVVIGGLSSAGALLAAKWINSRVTVQLDAEQHLELKSASNSTDALPPLWLSLLPIAIPFLLIAAGACSQAWGTGHAWSEMIETVGDKNVAVGIGTLIAIGLLRWARQRDQAPDILAKAVSGAGGIILITAAGGAFGAVLGQAGIAERMSLSGVTYSGLLLLTIAFLLTAAIRTLQGSATVAMITAAGIMQGVVTVESLPFHPVYLVLAIGGGSKPIAWMNDSGFWVMCKMSGMSEAQGLRTVSPLTIAMGVSTLFWTLLGAWLFPFKIAV